MTGLVTCFYYTSSAHLNSIDLLLYWWSTTVTVSLSLYQEGVRSQGTRETTWQQVVCPIQEGVFILFALLAKRIKVFDTCQQVVFLLFRPFPSFLTSSTPVPKKRTSLPFPRSLNIRRHKELSLPPIVLHFPPFRGRPASFSLLAGRNIPRCLMSHWHG